MPVYSLLVATDQSYSQPYAIVDNEERIFVVLCGQPKDPGWAGVVQHASAAMLDTSKRARLREPNRRGDFIPLNVGASYRGGSQVSGFVKICVPCADLRQFPGNLRDLAENAAIAEELRHNPDIQRMAGFANSKVFFPSARVRLTELLA